MVSWYRIRLAIVFLLWTAAQVCSFTTITTWRQRIPPFSTERYHHKDSVEESFRQTSSLIFNTTSSNDVLKRLVELGINASPSNGEEHSLKFTPWQRVPGCVAVVQVRTAVKNDDSVVMQGKADATVSQGLVMLLSKACTKLSPDQLLEINPNEVADYLELRSILSKGRNDGLASMMRVVQSQIKTLLSSNDTSELEATLPVLQEKNGRGRKRVAMLLSGGVDSSVALHLLLKEGYDVTAFYLKIWLEDELAHLGTCPWQDDLEICKSVCAHAGGVPLMALSLQQEYKERVLEYTLQEARKGRTPNPDIMCNSRIKFGCFYDAIKEGNFDFVASGHYAQVAGDSGNRKLLRAPDPIKDQSYFLCALSQQQLQRVLFPIGHLQKAQVRQLALEFNLPNKDRPDSQGLCFLGKIKFDDFLESNLGERPGDIVDAKTQELIGRHRGVWYHTVGQRKGLGLYLDPKATSRGPWYVVAKDPQRDIVYASNEYDEEAFTEARSEFELEDLHWILGEPPFDGVQRLDFKIRHGPNIVQGILKLDGRETTATVKLDKKDGGLAPGQYVAFYELGGMECLGGGVISEKHWTKFLLQHESWKNVTTTSALS